MKIKMIKNISALVFIFVFSFLFLQSCKVKCPKAEKNIMGEDGFRSDCPYLTEDQLNANTQKTLDFYFIYDNTDAFQEQIQAFQSEFPNIKIRTKKFVNLKEYEDLIINEIAEGEGPDVFMIHNSWITKHKKKLFPEPADLPFVITPDEFRQTYFQAAANDLIIDNKVYGLPLSLDNLAIYYNKSYFQDLLASSDKPASTWDKLKDQVFQLTKQNNSAERFALSGMAMGRADNISSAIDILYTLMLQYGVDFYDEKEEKSTFSDNKSSSSNIKNPGEEALRLYTSFALPSYKNYSWNNLITGYAPEDKEINPFIRGKVAMIIGYPYLYDELVAKVKKQQELGLDHINVKDIAVAPMPQLLNTNEATKRDTLASYFPLVVARTSDMPKEAWTFIEYLTTADSLQTYHHKTNKPSSRKDLVEDERTDPIFGVFASQAPFAKSFVIYDKDLYDKVFKDAIDAVINNTQSVQQALKSAENKITCIVKKQKKLIESSQDCGI